MKQMIGKITLASVLVALISTANVKPAEAQLGVWLGRAAWVAVGATGYHLWQRYNYGGGYGYGSYGPRGYYGYYGPPRYARYYGPPRGYYGY